MFFADWSYQGDLSTVGSVDEQHRRRWRFRAALTEHKAPQAAFWLGGTSQNEVLCCSGTNRVDLPSLRLCAGGSSSWYSCLVCTLVRVLACILIVAGTFSVVSIAPVYAQSCGDGSVDDGEDCDDGNGTDCDGCSAGCTSEGCGNGTLECSEECDDGNTANGDGCDSSCYNAVCGDGSQQGGEQCDDGNTVDGDGCDSGCTLEVCGNGSQQSGEECDDGNLTSGDGCDSNCTNTACGNGVVTTGEECDDGNLVGGDGCESNCTISSATNTPTNTPTTTPTRTPTNTPTATPTFAPQDRPYSGGGGGYHASLLALFPSFTPTYSPTATPSSTPTVSSTATPTITHSPGSSPELTPSATPTVALPSAPGFVGVAVRVAIDLTPLVGLDVNFEGETSTVATPPAQTDGSGIAIQLVKDTDTVTISSGLDAIQFEPVSGHATTLHSQGLIDIAASRRVKPAFICRFNDAFNRDSLAFYANNSSTKELSVPRRQTLNSLHSSYGSLTPTQPAEMFSPGLSLFSLPLDEFRIGAGPTQCAAGAWRFLGVELEFTCGDNQVEPNVPMCESRWQLPCVSLDEDILAKIRARVRLSARRMRSLEQEVKLLYPDANRNYTITRDFKKGTKRIKTIIKTLRQTAQRCSGQNPHCSEVALPRAALVKAFRRAFGPRPAKGQAYFRRVRKYHVVKFRKALSTLPKYLIRCD